MAEKLQVKKEQSQGLLHKFVISDVLTQFAAKKDRRDKAKGIWE